MPNKGLRTAAYNDLSLCHDTVFFEREVSEVLQWLSVGTVLLPTLHTLQLNVIYCRIQVVIVTCRNCISNTIITRSCSLYMTSDYDSLKKCDYSKGTHRGGEELREL